MSWDGTGLHPVIKMTAEEIMNHNTASAHKYADQHAKSEIAAKPMTEEQEAAHQIVRASEIASEAMEAIAKSMNSGFGMANAEISERFTN